MDELVSPELALVDPELALRLRLAESERIIQLGDAQRLARLEASGRPAAGSQPESEPRPPMAAADPEAHAKPRSRLVLTAVLAAVVGFGGAVASIEVLHVPVSAPRPAAEIVEVPAPVLQGVTQVQHGGPRPSAAVEGEQRIAVQRVVLGLLPAAARLAKVPRSIVDPATGLVRDLTTVSCPHPMRPAFECTVATPLSTIAVTVRRTGDGELTVIAKSSAGVGARAAG